jgi:hypothetical protein
MKHGDERVKWSDDPKAYTKPWAGKPIRFSLRTGVEIAFFTMV